MKSKQNTKKRLAKHKRVTKKRNNYRAVKLKGGRYPISIHGITYDLITDVNMDNYSSSIDLNVAQHSIANIMDYLTGKDDTLNEDSKYFLTLLVKYQFNIDEQSIQENIVNSLKGSGPQIEFQKILRQFIPISINNVFDYFEVTEDNRDYFKRALHDANGLYGLISKDGPTHTIYHDGKFVDTNTKYYNPKNNSDKYSDKLTIGNKLTSMYTKAEYTLIAIYNYAYKCIIFQSVINPNEYLVFFIWGQRVDLQGNKNVSIMYEFIKQKIEYNATKKVMFYGFSMGGNLAQNVALYFKREYKDFNNVYLVSIAIGGTLFGVWYNQFERLMKGYYLSIALLDSKEPIKFENKQIISKKGYNDYILPDNPDNPDKKKKTIKSLLIEFINKKTDNYIVVKDIHNLEDSIKENYENVGFITDNVRLHDYVKYRQILNMLIDDELIKERLDSNR